MSVDGLSDNSLGSVGLDGDAFVFDEGLGSSLGESAISAWLPLSDPWGESPLNSSEIPPMAPIAALMSAGMNIFVA